MEKVNLDEILFTEFNKLREDFPEEDWLPNEEMTDFPEFKYVKNAMKEACKQVLILAVENVKLVTVKKGFFGHEMDIDILSIIETINQVE